MERSQQRRRILKSLLAGAGLLLLLSGCGSPFANPTHDVEKSHLRWLLKVRTHAVSQGQSLKSQDDYKRYIQNLEPELREKIVQGAGVSNVEELFVSERDGQPYVIFYSQRPEGVANDLVGYEQTGVDGRRYVGYGLGVVGEEVDEQQFAELVPPAVRPAQ
jgi:hypothetical protein